MFKRFFHKRYLKLFCLVVFTSFFISARHPFFISVTTLSHNVKDKSLNITCKLFTNDIEDALRKLNTKKIDLINGSNKAELNTLLHNYIKSRLLITINGKASWLNWIGFEQEAEAIWCYLEIKNVNACQQINIENTLLYDFIKEQTNICQIEINGKTKSAKVSYPDKQLIFQF